MEDVLHFSVTFLLAALAGLGVGSGGLYLLWLREARGGDPSLTVTANLIFFIAALLSAAFMNLRKRRIDLGFLLSVLLWGIPGALLGQRLAAHLPSAWLRIFLGAFLIFSGIFSLVVQRKNKLSAESPKSSTPALDKKGGKRYND